MTGGRGLAGQGFGACDGLVEVVDLAQQFGQDKPMMHLHPPFQGFRQGLAFLAQAAFGFTLPAAP